MTSKPFAASQTKSPRGSDAEETQWPRRSRLLALPLLVILLLVGTAGRAVAQTAPAQLVSEALSRLLTFYVDPLDPAQLVREGYAGARERAAQTGVSPLPDLAAVPNDFDGAVQALTAGILLLDTATAGAVGPTELTYAALTAITAARQECHTSFLRPDAYRRLQDQLAGRVDYSGIGVQATTRAPWLVLQVFPGSPAEQAGLMAGDEIIAVDEVALADPAAPVLSALVRGPEGTRVRLTIRRDGSSAFDVVMQRALVRTPVVTHTLRGDGIGVIRLNVFTNDGSAARLLRDALAELEAAGAGGWVLDLRTNSGGSVSSVLEVLGLFVPEGVDAAAITSRLFGDSRLQVSGKPLLMQRPLAVLVGPSSASGAEIAAAVLRDVGRARLFGEHTSGCANMGAVLELADGSGLSITVGRVLAGPRERAIDGAGVAPDESYPMAAGDPAVQAAAAWLLRQAILP